MVDEDGTVGAEQGIETESGNLDKKRGRKDAGCTSPAHAPKENTYCFGV